MHLFPPRRFFDFRQRICLSLNGTQNMISFDRHSEAPVALQSEGCRVLFLDMGEIV